MTVLDADADADPGPAALPPLNALRSFEAVARSGSFAAAAEQLHVTHWAAGKQVRLLEEWFGVPLFERRARGVVLTDEGATLLADVSSAFERLASGAARLRHDRVTRRVTGVVRLNVLISVAQCWLLPRLADFHAAYPGIDVRISTTSRKLRTVAGAFDVAIRSGPETDGHLLSTPLMADLRLPACSPTVLSRHPIETPSDLRHHVLLHSGSTRSAWGHWKRAAGVPALRGARDVEFEHTFLQLAAAVEGLGVTLASLPMIERDLATGRLVCPLTQPTWRGPDYTLVVNPDRADDVAVKAFGMWLRQMAGGSPAPVTASEGL